MTIHKRLFDRYANKLHFLYDNKIGFSGMKYDNCIKTFQIFKCQN
jgi:hypothetical protein